MRGMCLVGSGEERGSEKKIIIIKKKEGSGSG